MLESHPSGPLILDPSGVYAYGSGTIMLSAHILQGSCNSSTLDVCFYPRLLLVTEAPVMMPDYSNLLISGDLI